MGRTFDQQQGGEDSEGGPQHGTVAAKGNWPRSGRR